MTDAAPLDLAVIGGGVAGLTAAHLLQRRHRVTLYERRAALGGHTRTIDVPVGPDRGLPVDIGFIVFNHRTYPLFTRLLDQLGVPTRESDMSFSLDCRRSGLVYASHSVGGLFAQRRNLVRPAYLVMLLEILRFNRAARRDLRAGRLAGITLGAYLRAQRFRPFLRDHYIIPMAAAIWSSPDAEILDFPMETFARFFDNHGLLRVTDQPRWRFVAGGSRTYVAAFTQRFRGAVAAGAPVAGLLREADGVRVRLANGALRRHDGAVVATHADEALALLEDPSPEERRALAPWRYSANDVVLHTDPSWMPEERRAWASWNYRREAAQAPGAPLTLTYHMNRLQRLETPRPYFVTLNPTRPIPAARVIHRTRLTHPTYTFASLAAQERLPGLNGRRRTWFCGSYFGYGFHEDAVRAGVEVGRSFGIDL